MENNDISTGGYCLSTISTNPWLRLEVIIFPVVGWRKLELGRFLLQTSKPSQVSLGPWNTFALFKPQIYYWWFVLLTPAPPPSKSASSGLLCDTKTCTLRKVLQCSSKCQWMFSYLHSFKPSTKTMGEIRSSRKRLFNRNVWADWSSLQGLIIQAL